MKRQILLIEPNYRNKYPPIGLMKIATYHRMLGDNVVFFKGDLRDFVIDGIYQDCLQRLYRVSSDFPWRQKTSLIKQFIKTKRVLLLPEILQGLEEEEEGIARDWLEHFGDYYRRGFWKLEPQWDRVYVTSLFTFYWKITIKTIEFAKSLVKDIDELWVGGVMASLIPKEIEEATGIKPFKGLLNKPGILDDNQIIIDDLPLDYSILDEVEYQYPTRSAYFTFMTKGCTRSCAFCAVPKIETVYQEKVPTLDKLAKIKEQHGDQRHLLLMDNNVLASPKFPEIIQEIKEMGFTKGAKFIEPNQYEIAIRNLRQGKNERASINRCFSLLMNILQKRMRGETSRKFYKLLSDSEILDKENLSKQVILNSYRKIAPIYEKYRDKRSKLRYVDFNQGTDARYVTEENMKLMSEIPIYPLRIAFDYIGLKKKYIRAVELAAKNGIDRLSNYLLYNFVDKPDDLYERMRINIDLSENLGVHIYSFPMKYIPLFGEESKNRYFIGKHWNRKFVRAIQSILNVTKGIVAPERSFFQLAFGKDLQAFREILYMPETYIIYRKRFEEVGLTQQWREQFHNIPESQKEMVIEVIEKNDFANLSLDAFQPSIAKFLWHYTVGRNDVPSDRDELVAIKAKYDRMIRQDQFVDLTLTYDFDEGRRMVKG